MDKSINAHRASCNAIVEWVWFGGTDALLEGEAVCYNTDYGTAANVDGGRNNRVERPSTSNNLAFAGVAARSYSAKSGGQMVEINVPGSKGVKVALGVDTVLGEGYLTFTAGGGGGAGRFVKKGLALGRGSIIPRQTVTAVLEASMVGAWSLATDGVTLTVSSTTGLAAGDTVVFVGGEKESTTKAINPGKYTISSITSSTVLVLTATAVVATPDAAVTCTGYAYTGNPTCQADLFEGSESGGVEFLSVLNAGNAAQTAMVGGMTYICGGLTIAADVDVITADEVVIGALKGYSLLGAMTTSYVTIVPATVGYLLVGTALTEITAMDAAGDNAYIQWFDAWNVVGLAGDSAAA